MVASSTNNIESSASPQSFFSSRSASSTRRARRAQRTVSTGTSFCSSATKISTASTTTSGAFGLRVRVDDVLQDAVTDDVAARELDELEAVDAGEHAAGGKQAGTTAAVGEVDLGHVARDHCLRTEPESGQEHLHLLGRRVLR